ncbi:hypothetical protein ACLMJK_006353 [Lecanora helva]
MADAFNKEAFTLLGVGVAVIGVRTFARLMIVKNVRHFALDDYLMLFAAVIYGLETAAAYSVGARYMGLANNSMTPQQRAELSPDSKEYHLRVGGSKLQLMGWSSYTLLLWTLKTCPSISHIDLYVTVILNVLTDAYLLTIPIPLLWRSQISVKEKTALIVLFSGALFIMMAGILRCVLILTAGAKSAQQAGSWAVRETFVAVVVSNLPIIYSLLRGIFKSLSEYTISINKRSNASSSRHVRLGDMSGSRDRPVVRSGRSRDPYPLTSSSLEHIVQEEDIESKSHDNRHTHGTNSKDSGIVVATRTEVSSEDKSHGDDADRIYQCHVSS